MLKNIFLPEKIGGNYLFPKRILGIEIRKSEVRAAKILLRGTTTTLEACARKSLPLENASHTDRVREAIKSLAEKLKPFDSVHTCLPSSLMAFRELKLPFTTREQIKMVVQFEVEPLLPFPSSEAIIDFIITSIDEKEKSATVLVAAVQKKHLIEHLALFEETGVDPNIVTVDLFAVYGLYKQLPSYASKTDGMALLNIGAQSTEIAYILNGSLKLARTIHQGVLHVAKRLAKELNVPANDIMEQLVRFGVGGQGDLDTQKMHSALMPLVQAIKLTLTSFSAQAEGAPGISGLLAFGSGAEITGLAPLIGQGLDIACEVFDDQKIIEAGIQLTSKRHDCTLPRDVVCIATAMPTPQIEEFNLRRGPLERADEWLVAKQVIVSSSLLVLILIMLTAHAFIQRGRLARELAASRQEATKALIDRFPDLAEEATGDLGDLVESADEELKREEATWSKFSATRPSVLKYLLELTNLIDREKLGFVLDQLTITEDAITLKARVRDHNALVLFERDLRQSKLFGAMESPDDPVFVMKISLARNGRGPA